MDDYITKTDVQLNEARDALAKMGRQLVSYSMDILELTQEMTDDQAKNLERLRVSINADLKRMGLGGRFEKKN